MHSTVFFVVKESGSQSPITSIASLLFTIISIAT
jgi:hypothetical protein